jgi:hypothetical protein
MESSLSRLIAHELGDELTQALDRLKHCLNQLTDAQVWWRPAEAMNSIGNLLLHLAGNVRQWIVAGLGGAKDERFRQGEFDERRQIPKDELLAKLEATVAEAKAAMGQQTPEKWARVRRIQSFEVTGLGAAVHSVSHFRGHTQEIIHLTRTQLGERYKFDFVPKTKEQGAAV